MDSLFERPQKREFGELNIVPIIDMFATVIFFLLLSTVFIELNKLTVPPSRVSTVTSPAAIPPLAAMLMLANGGHKGELRLVLSWSGRSPGQTVETVKPDPTGTPLKSSNLVSAALRLTKDFHQKYPEEKTLQMGLERGLEYQQLISVMDGARDQLPDIVLISYDDVERRVAGSGL